jgi:hypothetical protein
VSHLGNPSIHEDVDLCLDSRPSQDLSRMAAPGRHGDPDACRPQLAQEGERRGIRCGSFLCEQRLEPGVLARRDLASTRFEGPFSVEVAINEHRPRSIKAKTPVDEPQIILVGEGGNRCAELFVREVSSEGLTPSAAVQRGGVGEHAIEVKDSAADAVK